MHLTEKVGVFLRSVMGVAMKIEEAAMSEKMVVLLREERR